MLARLGGALLAALSLPALALDEPASPPLPTPGPVPSGMDLLYSDRVIIGPDGEPIVALGLMTGQKRVVVRARSTVVVDFYEGEIQKRTVLQPGSEVAVTLRRTKPAMRRYYVDVEGVAFGDTEALALVRAKWLGRGYDEMQTVEEGTVMGIGGRIIDNREYRMWLPAASEKAARAESARIYANYGDRVSTVSKLGALPWAELDVKLGAMPLGKAVSFVRFASADGAPIEVADVSFGKGYAWAGREARAYHGEIYAVVDPDGMLAAVNVVGAEELLNGVVPSEIFASAPLEALKAQAVAARNQLFSKLGKRHHDDPFHLCGEQHCQVYTGVNREDVRASAAVLETRGEVLFRRGKLVDTVYSSSCGGHTEDNDVVWGDKPDPALRGRPDFDEALAPELAPYAKGVSGEALGAWVQSAPRTYCSLASQARSNKFRWQKAFSEQELTRMLGEKAARIGRLTAIVVGERGNGGRVMSLTLKGDHGEHTVVHELPIRQLFGNLNSGAFLLEQETDADGHLIRAVFRGAGWGHGVGMCQMGAIGRAEHGQGYRDILGHYYNGADVERVYGITTSQLH